ncbi:MAG: hypothetical protein R3Y21_00025, partial [Mycoplasmatota bacterium]
FDHTIKSTALYHFALNVIILHPKNKNDMTRLKISILHELDYPNFHKIQTYLNKYLKYNIF